MKRYGRSSYAAWSTLALLILAASSVASARAATIYDAAAEFSPTDNPNGPWSYGYKPTFNGPFIPAAQTGAVGPIDFWYGGVASDGNPAISRNGSTSTAFNGTARYLPGQLVMHPGPGNEYAVLRFTNPEAGLASFTASFEGVDIVGTTTDVYVLQNGSVVFSGLVNGFGPGTGPTFTTPDTFALNRGDTLDFMVGFGNGNYFFDSTGVSVRITVVPEPGTLALSAVGLAAMVWLARPGRTRLASAALCLGLAYCGPVARPALAQDERTVAIPSGDYAVGELNGGTRLKLKGKCNTLTIGLIDGKSTLDASELEAKEIIFTDKIDGKSTVKLNAPNGSIEFRKKVDGQSKLEVDAPNGSVTFTDPGGFLNEGSKIDGQVSIKIIAKHVEFKAKIDGGPATHVVVTLTAGGSLKFSEVLGKSRLHYRKEKPEDPEPSVEAGRIDDAEFKMID